MNYFFRFVSLLWHVFPPPFLNQLYNVILTLQLDQFLGEQVNLKLRSGSVPDDGGGLISRAEIIKKIFNGIRIICRSFSHKSFDHFLILPKFPYNAKNIDNVTKTSNHCWKINNYCAYCTYFKI